jgi:hypothetical protein
MDEIAFWSDWFEQHNWPVERRDGDRGVSYHFEEDGRARMIFCPYDCYGDVRDAVREITRG